MMTSEHLTPNQEALTELSADSLAKIFQQPENKSGLGEKDRVCSLKPSDSFAWLDQDSSSWKTSQLCLLTGWATYSQSFPRSGLMLNGLLYQQPKWVESTKEKESLLLPTPDANMGSHHNIKQTWNGRSQLHLAQAIAYLPTPKSVDGIHPGVATHKRGQTLHLSAAVQNLLPSAVNRKLSPALVEKMMGFQEGWTDIEESNQGIIESDHLLRHSELNEWLEKATDTDTIPYRKERLQALGNSVVPNCAAVVWQRVSKMLQEEALIDADID